jgi:hypothetical protein
VHRRHKHHPFLDPGSGSAFLDFFRDVDDLLPLLGIERQVRGMSVHAG